MRLNEILPKLEGIRESGGKFTARCPAHDDRNPSLSVSERDGKILLHCFAGRSVDQVLTALGVEAKDLFGEPPKNCPNGKRDERATVIREHIYVTADGTPVAKRLRWGSHDKTLDRRLKEFSWQRWENGEWKAGLGERGQAILPIYHEDKCLAAASHTLVMLTEGEHDADAGESLGYLTVTTGGTTGILSAKHVEMLRGRNVVIVSHADKEGRSASEKRAALLYKSCASVKIIEIPTCKDLADAVEKGVTRAVS